MQDHKHSLSATFVLTAVVLSGCSMHPSVSNTAVDAIPQSQDAVTAGNPQWLRLNKRLAKRLAVEQVLTKRFDGVLAVQLDLNNRKKSPTTFETRFEWFDAEGLEVRDTTSHWTHRMVDGKGVSRIRAMAPSDRVVTYRFLVRPDNS